MTGDRQAYNAVIHAPHGRDADLAALLLAEVDIETTICRNFPCLSTCLNDDVWFVLMTEETGRSSDLREVVGWIERQPTWSDLPFIILTAKGGGPEQNPSAARLSGLLGNVIFLERPFHPTTFVSVAKAALRQRHRQFEARARIEALHETEQRLRTALLAGHLGPWEWDLATGELDCSPVCKAVFGRTPEERFNYDDLIASIHPNDLPRMQQTLQHCVATGEDYEIDYQTVWPDGSVHWAEARGRFVLQAGQRRMVGVCLDITARKTAEGNLLRLNETLEERVLERTAELERVHATVLAEVRQREKAEEQLRQSQKMESIGQLTGGVAHDFNNLLMAVLGNLDLLQSHVGDDPKIARYIEGALQGAKRGAALTQRLLAFARRQDLRVEPIDAIALVRGMNDLLERSVGPIIDMRFDLPARLPLALADANQVELALLNLVVNARDAMPSGGSVTVRLDAAQPSASDELKPGSYVRLSVIDTGSGMDDETLKRAIDPFFSTKELGKGTGLGLSMIHGLARQLEGALRLSSEVGAGTRAELWLPASSASVVKEIAPLPEVPPVEETPKLNILLVDDDFLIAMSTRSMLEDLGHEVVECSSAADALEVIRNEGTPLDILITDYAMPKMTGAQLAYAARELRPDLPILLATGYAELPAGEELNLPRLSKPYLKNDLASALMKLQRVGNV